MLKKLKDCLMGKEGLKLHNSLAKDIENETVESIIDILGEYCLPKKEWDHGFFKTYYM